MISTIASIKLIYVTRINTYYLLFLVRCSMRMLVRFFFPGGKIRNSNFALDDRFNISLFDPKLPYRSCLPSLLPPFPVPPPEEMRYATLFLYCVRRTMCVHHWSVGRGGSSTSQSVCERARARAQAFVQQVHTQDVLSPISYLNHGHPHKSFLSFDPIRRR